MQATSKLLATAATNQWLMMGHPEAPLVDPWIKLKITDDALGFASPSKKRETGTTTFSSPISTLTATWSPQAVVAPPLKSRKASQELLCI